jgi:hypothetical protein
LLGKNSQLQRPPLALERIRYLFLIESLLASLDKGQRQNNFSSCLIGS